jgi:flavin reductase (DIM6/NTAB) family NADH-FMN oxidoreductase RutF
MTFDSRTFRDALGRFATGVCIVTTCDANGRPYGVTVNSFSSVSLDPPLVLFSLDRVSTSFDQFMRGSHFAVNVLCRGQMDLSRTFAATLADKWNGVPFVTWETGAPILPGSLASLECDAVAKHDAGDHVILVGRVRRLHCAEEGEPLLYFRGRYRDIEVPGSG